MGLFCANDNGNGFVADHYSYYARRNKLPYSEPLSCSQITKLLKKLLSLGLFCANDNGNGFVADHYSYYARRNKLPYSEPLSCSQITKLLKNISEASVLNFFSEYAKQLYENNSLNKNRFWALDSTSISTYSRYLDAKYGHNKQGEDLPQVNVMMMTDEKSGRPLFYEMFNGSIPDISTIAKTFKMLLQLDVRSFVAVMDRGYYSKDNLSSIINCGYHFLSMYASQQS